MADARQIERQIHILSVLSESKQGYTVQELHHSMQKLGIDVSRKTIERDIDDISKLFYVYEEEGQKETRYRADKFKIDNIAFNISELLSLYFLQQVIKPYQKLDVGTTAATLIQKILERAPAIHQSYIDSVSDLFIVNPAEVIPEKNLDENYLQLAREAIEKQYQLELEYFSFNNDEITSRVIDPYVLEIREGCYHLIGFCHLRSEVRDFRVSRIKKMEMLDETFDKPEDFYKQYSQNRFGKMTSDEDITLKIIFEDEAARYIKEYEANKADKITDIGEGKILFEKKTTFTPDIIQWVLRFGADAEVIEPEALRFEVMWEAKRMAQKYKK
ncbi:MAG: WYL domain-containing protein [Ruminiclostridium sp.]|nr:WYL domain-containing protein [Ruminiclostridium sp.]